MSSVPLSWRLQKPRYRLVGTRCAACTRRYFPPRPLCNDCRRKGKIEEYPFRGEGTVVTFTVIRAAPEGFEEYAPYAVAIIELEGGVTVAGQVVGDPAAVAIGKAVRTVFRRMAVDDDGGLIHYGLKWEIAE